MRRHSTKRAGRAGLIGVFALAMTLFGASAGAQDNVIVEDTGNQRNTGQVDLRIGDACFTEATTVVTAEVLSPGDEYNPDTVTNAIVGSETVLNAVPCGDPEDPGDPDEVLGIVEEPDEVLAFTGSDVNRPISLGFALVGVGGLVLYVAKRAEAGRDEATAAEV